MKKTPAGPLVAGAAGATTSMNANAVDVTDGAGSGPAAADGGVGGRHVVAGGLDFLAVAVGLFVDGLEVAAQLGDELLAGHRTPAPPEVTGGQHIPHHGLFLPLHVGRPGADHPPLC